MLWLCFRRGGNPVPVPIRARPRARKGRRMSEDVDWTNADFADGPTLAAWFDANVPEGQRERMVGSSLRRWRRGESAGFELVDRHVTALGFHVSELPGGVWRRGRFQGDVPRSKGPRAEALAMLADGHRPKDVADRLAVPVGTVRQWKARELRRPNGISFAGVGS